MAPQHSVSKFEASALRQDDVQGPRGLLFVVQLYTTTLQLIDRDPSAPKMPGMAKG